MKLSNKAKKNFDEDNQFYIDLGKKILSTANISTRGTTRMSVSAPVSKEWRGSNTTPKTGGSNELPDIDASAKRSKEKIKLLGISV